MNDSRPLPLDLARLQSYLPAEPMEGAVARARSAVARIDTLVAQLAGLLDRYNSAEEALVDALVDAATAGDNLEHRLAQLDPGQRPTLEHRLAQLGKARNVASYRVDLAQRSDPDWLAWRQACAAVTAEWHETMDAAADGSDTDRLRHLERFAASH